MKTAVKTSKNLRAPFQNVHTIASIDQKMDLIRVYAKEGDRERSYQCYLEAKEMLEVNYMRHCSDLNRIFPTKGE